MGGYQSKEQNCNEELQGVGINLKVTPTLGGSTERKWILVPLGSSGHSEKRPTIKIIMYIHLCVTVI